MAVVVRDDAPARRLLDDVLGEQEGSGGGRHAARTRPLARFKKRAARSLGLWAFVLGPSSVLGPSYVPRPSSGKQDHGPWTKDQGRTMDQARTTNQALRTKAGALHGTCRRASRALCAIPRRAPARCAARSATAEQ